MVKESEKKGSKNGSATKKVVVAPALKREFTELSKVNTDYSEEQLNFVRATLAPTLDDNELRLFIYRAQELGLNPLNGEIFAYSSSETVRGTKQRKLVMIVARDGKRKLAFRTGHLKSVVTNAVYVRKGMVLRDSEQKADGAAKEVETIERVAPWEGGKLWGAACVITRDDFEQAFNVVVPLSEYQRSSHIWQNKPDTMIKKVAESQCLSMAFPELAGVYDEAERWGNGDAKVAPQIAGGGKPATEAQLKTIEAMGGDADEKMTKQEAAELIMSLNSKKK